MAAAKDVVARRHEGARASPGLAGSQDCGCWLVGSEALVAGPDHYLPSWQQMRMDLLEPASEDTKGHVGPVDHSPDIERGSCATPGRAPKHTPITTATMRLNASDWCSLGLVFISISRLASLRAESHIDLP